jgi:hypothetical protein
MASYCWALTRLDVFALSDEDCENLMTAHEEKKAKISTDPVGICWDILTKHLSDDLFLKVSHVGKGRIGSLVAEIRASLAVSTVEDVQPLRVDLHGVDMVRDCGNDLQTYISFIISRRNKLQFLNSEVPQNELIHIFIKGLSPIFQPLQVHFAIPGTLPDEFEKVVAIVRKFSAAPQWLKSWQSIAWPPPMFSSPMLLHRNLGRNLIAASSRRMGPADSATNANFRMAVCTRKLEVNPLALPHLQPLSATTARNAVTLLLFVERRRPMQIARSRHRLFLCLLMMILTLLIP